MKKFIFILVLVSLLSLSACGNSRDLSTPSSRLVGHWKAGGITSYEYYLTAIDKEIGEGKITLYKPNSGTVETGTYKIASEQPDGKAVEISVLWSGYGDSTPGMFYFEIPAEAMEARINGNYIEYIDDKTEYEPGN